MNHISTELFVGLAPPNHWRDRAFALLRVLCFCLSLAFGLTHLGPGETGQVVSNMTLIFGLYSLICYGIWRYIYPRLSPQRFHLALNGLDFFFIIALLGITGGPDSPMSRGLYVWVSMTAIMFRFRGGLLASMVAAAAFLWMEWLYAWPLEPWERCFYLLGFLVHGPFVGHFMTREYHRSRDLEEAHSALDEAHFRLKNHQAQAIQAEKLATIGLIGASLAHEINNPVMGMKACVQGLREGTSVPGRAEEYLDVVDQGLDRIQKSVSSVLRYARPDRQPSDRIDLKESILNVIRLIKPLAREKDIQLHVLAESLTVEIAAGPLEQAIVNLMLNAIYASPREGKVCCRLSLSEDRMAITVEDEGPGFNIDHISRLREPFFTTKPEGDGTGIGLSVVDGFTRGIGGRLRLENGPDGAIATMEFLLTDLGLKHNGCGPVGG
jgi:signal transduction histidine kinase